MSTSKKLENLPKPAKVLLGVGGLADAGLRAYALMDIARRDQEDLNGPKELWVGGLALVNSLGILPLVYLKWGRKN